MQIASIVAFNGSLWQLCTNETRTATYILHQRNAFTSSNEKCINYVTEQKQYGFHVTLIAMKYASELTTKKFAMH